LVEEGGERLALNGAMCLLHERGGLGVIFIGNVLPSIPKDFQRFRPSDLTTFSNYPHSEAFRPINDAFKRVTEHQRSVIVYPSTPRTYGTFRGTEYRSGAEYRTTPTIALANISVPNDVFTWFVVHFAVGRFQFITLTIWTLQNLKDSENKQ
jgi:hypothetical protein